jgi:hypothetical protein
MFSVKTGLKQGDALLPWLFQLYNMPLGRFSNQNSLKLCSTHQLLVCVVDVNMRILGGTVHAINNTEALVAASKERGIEVNPDETKYMVMSPYQNAGRTHSI